MKRIRGRLFKPPLHTHLIVSILSTMTTQQLPTSPSAPQGEARILTAAAREPVGNNGGQEGDGGSQTGLLTRTLPKTARPSLYRVLLLNDDYTPMEFVVHVLERFFHKNVEEATQIMLHVHQKGVGVCGIFTYEVAETKVTQVVDFARRHQHPLQCTMEKE